MRSMMRKITLLAAALLIMAVPVLAAEGTVGGMIDQGKQDSRDECLIVAKNCPDSRADSLFQKVDRLRGEISRGTSVYTPDELNILEKKLEDAVKAAESAYENG